MSRADRIARLLRRPRRRPGPLRVVHVCGTPNGAYWMVQIAAGLRDRGYDVSAVIAGAGGSTARNLAAAGIPYAVDTHTAPRIGPVRQALKRRLIQLFHGRGLYGFNVVNGAIPLARTLRRLEADVVHSYVFDSIIPTRIAGLLAGVPVRVSMLTGPLQLQWQFMREWDLRTLWIDQRVISGSGRTAQLYRELGVPASKVADIHFGAESALFDPSREDTAAIRAELGVGPETPLVGNVAYFYGSLPPSSGHPFDATRGLKGQEDFVAAARIVHDARPDVRFVLVGAGWGPVGEEQYRRVQQQVHDLGLDEVVFFAGQRPRVADVLAALDVSVQCPITDNYGGTLESLLMEAPTIATDVGPMSEVIRHEETGLLVPPMDPPALAAAMLRLVDDPDLGRRLGRAGRELILAEFEMAQTIDRIDALYRELARDAGLDAPPLR